jgi:hypothetical protein
VVEEIGECVLQLHGVNVLFVTCGSRIAAECRHSHGDAVHASRQLVFIGRQVAAAGLSIRHVAGTSGKAHWVVRVELLLLELLLLVLGWGRRIDGFKNKYNY